MDDASLLTSLPDDVNGLKRLLVAREEQLVAREEQLVAREEQLVVRDEQLAQRERVITEHRSTIATQLSTITKLTQQRDEYYVEKLRLEVQLAKALKQAYGPRADRVRDLGQLLLGFGEQLDALAIQSEDLRLEADEHDEAGTDRPSATRRLRTRGRRDIGALNHLPLIEQVYELTDELCRCPNCQADREKIGSAISYTVEYIPGSLVRIRHVQHKYACRQCEQNGHNRLFALEKQLSDAALEKQLNDARPGAGAAGDELHGHSERLQTCKRRMADERLRRRQAEAVPLLESLHTLLLEQKTTLLPKHPLAQAIGYALNQWSALTLFVSDPAVPIHNNLAEQQMKRVALLRKNALFVATPGGGETAAILSTLTSTCRRHEINPQAYLTQLLANLPDTPMSRVDEWLPDEWKKRSVGRAAESSSART